MAVSGTMKSYSGLIGEFEYDDDLFKVVDCSSECEIDKLIYIGPIEDGINIEIPKGCHTLIDTFRDKEFLCKHVSFRFNDVKYTRNIFMNCVFGGSITTMDVSKILYFDSMFEGATFRSGFFFPWDFCIPSYANYDNMFCGIKADIPLFPIRGIENVLTGNHDGTLCKIKGLEYHYPGYDLTEDTYWDEGIIQYFSVGGSDSRKTGAEPDNKVSSSKEDVKRISCDQEFEYLYKGTGRTLNEVITLMKSAGWDFKDIIKSELKILGDLTWDLD